MSSLTKPGAPGSGKQYWRSLEDLADTPEFRAMVEREFPTLLEDVVTPSTRRGFLKLMGASLALGGVGLTGCRRWPEEHIAPFAHRPAGRIPGTTQQYATVMEVGGVAEGLLAIAYDGRPIKLEGNPGHPTNRGATSVFAQASVLSQYDPQRSIGVKSEGNASTFAAFTSAITSRFNERKSNGGGSIAVLTEASSSVTLEDVKRRLMQAYPNLRWHEYEAATRDNERAGTQLAYGAPHRTHYSFSDAEVIVSLDADVLGSHPAWIKHAREFAEARRYETHADRAFDMSRLYVAESRVSITGIMADHRLATKSKNIAAVAVALTKKLAAAGVNIPGAASLPDVSGAWLNETMLDAAVADLLAARQQGHNSIIAVGEHQPAEVHALGHALNQALGNVGNTVTYSADPNQGRASHADSIRSLVEAINAGSVDTLVILGGNPVYNAPADLNFGEAMKRVVSVHLSDYVDETSALANWHVPRALYLETWTDARAWDGTISIGQPIVEPFYGGKTPAEVLAVAMGDEVTDSYGLTRRAMQPILGEANFERAWRKQLHDGVVENSAWPTASVALQGGGWMARLGELAGNASSGVQVDEVVFTTDASMHDGRYANNGWLQELPDPITKITWDNAAIMSPRTAEALGVSGHDMVTVAANGQSPITIAAHIVPGHPDGSVTLPLGYGRTNAGNIGENVGFNTYRLRTTGGMMVASDARVERTSGHYELAVTQDHHIMTTAITERGKQDRLPQIVEEANLHDFENLGRKAFTPEWDHKHEFPLVSLWEEHQYTEQNYKWGMSIDLSSCIGCSACVVACQAENNIPVVGKDQVLRGREMHWIRIDRYFKFKHTENGFDHGTVESIVVQPVACQHCETAPCEQVCPVAATVHDHDGLNVMVYNRCVGTRYCSNNCPYKVRRFNFYDWHARNPRNEGLQQPYLVMPDERANKDFSGEGMVRKGLFNPEVTVRSVGVMEKCSFCVQRINEAKINAKNEWVQQPDEVKKQQPKKAPHIPDGTVTPACAQSCPTQAIVFGDLNDPNSRVSVLRKSKRNYQLLEYLNTKPRNRFLGRLRNPNPTLVPPRKASDDGHGAGGGAH